MCGWCKKGKLVKALRAGVPGKECTQCDSWYPDIFTPDERKMLASQRKILKRSEIIIGRMYLVRVKKTLRKVIVVSKGETRCGHVGFYVSLRGKVLMGKAYEARAFTEVSYAMTIREELKLEGR